MIERTRKRPRVKSVNFRTFWWLLTAEATVNVLSNTRSGLDNANVRAWIARSSMFHVRRFGEGLIRQDRGRRIWP